MKTDMEDEFIGVFIEIMPAPAGELEFRCGCHFPDGTPPETVEYFKTLTSGIFGMISAHREDLISMGEVVRSVSDFEVPHTNMNGEELIFTPADELIEEIASEKIIDLRLYKPSPSKKKH